MSFVDVGWMRWDEACGVDSSFGVSGGRSGVFECSSRRSRPQAERTPGFCMREHDSGEGG